MKPDHRWTLVYSLIAACSAPAQTPATPNPSAVVPATVPSSSGGPREPRVHDPSTIVREGGDYWFFCTGNGVSAWRSRDLMTWKREQPVFSTMPAWHREVVPEQKGHLWAPDVIKLGGRFLVYYSVSKFGVNTSAIGLATATTLDPANANHGWRDEGIIVQSRKEDKFNAIDPAIFRDDDGRLWMSFGSFWSGIKLLELDAKTGKRIAEDAPLFSIAWKEAIEAPAIHKRDGWYYLFVNWGICCRGADSTYEIRVGRSRQITGPYLDREGVDLMKGGGTKFLATEGTMIGPGHVGIFSEEGRDWLGIHFYDGADKGRPTFALRELTWADDRWPVAGAVRETRLLSAAQTQPAAAP
ncbi:MAG: arabinan endo-1,5-alpha-L-arabinosidase [Nibricoccus sp.]